MELILNDLRGDYVNLVHHVINGGHHVTARGLPTRELTAVTMIFPDTLAPLLPIGVGRGVNLKLAALEALQLISGTPRSDLVEVAAPTFSRVLVDQSNPDYGAYGPRVVEQIADCIDLLRDDPSTRQAISLIWNERDLMHEGDKPCTVFLQFIIRAQHDITENSPTPALEMHTHMRSQDVWLGVPYDIFMFTQLQYTVARALRVPVGRYVHHTTSLHIYDRDLEAAKKLHEPTVDLTDAEQLPLGVCDDPGSGASPIDVAAYLLDDSANDVEELLNEWYVRQLEAIDALCNEADDDER